MRTVFTAAGREPASLVENAQSAFVFREFLRIENDNCVTFVLHAFDWNGDFILHSASAFWSWRWFGWLWRTLSGNLWEWKRENSYGSHWERRHPCRRVACVWI